jgi:hypothetical protein
MYVNCVKEVYMLYYSLTSSRHSFPPSLSENDIFPLWQYVVFLYTPIAPFSALILPYFAFILPFYFQLSRFFHFS